MSVQAPARRQPENHSVAKWWLRGVSIAVLAVVWESAARSAQSLLLPSFSATMAALAGLASGGELWIALRVSNEALVLGLGAALVAGVPLGLAMGRLPWLNAALSPYLDAVLAVPMAALLPLLVAIVGIGLGARATVVFMFTVAVVVMSARTGVVGADRQLLEMARAFGATRGQIWCTVLLPGALPALMTGLRLGLGRAVAGMVVAELLLVAAGVGRLILDAQAGFEAAVVYAVVLVVVAEAILLVHGSAWVARRLSAWDGETAFE